MYIHTWVLGTCVGLQLREKTRRSGNPEVGWEGGWIIPRYYNEWQGGWRGQKSLNLETKGSGGLHFIHAAGVGVFIAQRISQS